MFVVFASVNLFLTIGKPAYAILPLFLTTILAAGLVETVTAPLYSEPINRLLHARWQRTRNGDASECPVETALEG